MKQTVKPDSQQKIAAIQELTAAFCKEHFNEEFAVLANKLTQKVHTEINPSPLLKGKPETWAAAIIHVLGYINFMYDKSQPHYISSSTLHDFFKTSTTPVTTKSKLIRDRLELHPYHREFTISSLLEQNPFDRFVLVNDMLMPMEFLPEEIQEEVRKQRALGHEVEITIPDEDEDIS